MQEQIQINNNDDNYSDLISDFDFATLLIVLKKSIIYVILIFITAISAAYLYNRYTKPIYESSSILKLEVNKDARILEFAGGNQDIYNTLLGEIELIKSRRLVEKVVDRLNLNVSYYLYGSVLYEEKYNNHPFELSYYQIYDNQFLNKAIDLEFIDENSFYLIVKNNDNEIKQKYSFGDIIDIPNLFKIIIKKTDSFGSIFIGEKMFFKIHDKNYLVNYISNSLSVNILSVEAATIRLSFKDHTPNKAADIINAFDSVYLIETVAQKVLAHEQTINFLKETLAKTEHDLEAAELEIESFLRKNKTVDIKGSFSTLTSKIEEIAKERTELNETLQLLDEVQVMIEDGKEIQLFIPALTNVNDPQLTSLISKLNELYLERDRIAASQNENTFVLKQKNHIIDNTVASILELVKQNKKILYTLISETNKKYKQLEVSIDAMPSKETQFVRLKRFYDLYEKMYLLMISKEAEFRIAKAGSIPNFIVLSPGLVNMVPVYPNVQLLYTGALGIALFLSVAMILLRYFLHDTISTNKELEKSLDAFVLGGIPEYKKNRMEFSKLIVDSSPKSAISEAFRTVRTNLEFVCPQKDKRIFSVTSTVGGEGKTFISTNLAGIIALSNQRVIILDLDMRKPKVHLAFDADNINGMSTILIGKIGWKDCVKDTSIDNLKYISAGPVPPNPSELILRPEFDSLIKELHQNFDVIIFDTPPIGLVTDGVILMKKADAPLYVVRANYSKKGVKKTINSVVRTGGFTKLSVIVNAVNESNVYGYGGYGYGYGSGYGYGYYDLDVEKLTFKDTLLKFFKLKR